LHVHIHSKDPLINVSVAVSKPEDYGEWKDAVVSFFAGVGQEIGSCSVHSKLILSDSGKMFAPVKGAEQNYR